MSWRDEMHQDLIEFFGLTDIAPHAFDISFEQCIETYTTGYCSCCDAGVELEQTLIAHYSLPVRKHRSQVAPHTTWEDFFKWVDNGKPER
jgi:hypothetical protein